MGNQLAAPQKLAADVGELPVVVKDSLGASACRFQFGARRGGAFGLHLHGRISSGALEPRSA